MSKLVIRTGTIADAEMLSQLGSRTFSETFATDNTRENLTAYLAASFNLTRQTSELSDPRSCVRIAEIDDVAVGYAMLRAGKAPSAVKSENPVELVRLYVSKESIGSGVGAALMNDCLRESAQRGHKTIWLGVWEHNHRAQAFYRKWKFIEVGTHVFQLGDDAQTDLLMQRAITERETTTQGSVFKSSDGSQAA